MKAGAWVRALGLSSAALAAASSAPAVASESAPASAPAAVAPARPAQRPTACASTPSAESAPPAAASAAPPHLSPAEALRLWDEALAELAAGHHVVARDRLRSLYVRHHSFPVLLKLIEAEELAGAPMEALYLRILYLSRARTEPREQYRLCEDKARQQWIELTEEERDAFLQEHCARLPREWPMALRRRVPPGACEASVRIGWTPPLPAQLSIDGRPLEHEPGTLTMLRRGCHVLRVQPAEGQPYRIAEREIEVRPGNPPQIIELQPQAVLWIELQGRARVLLDRQPLDAAAALDPPGPGGFYGKQVLRVPVRPGDHEVTAVGPWLGRQSTAHARATPGSVSPVRVRPPSLKPSLILGGLALVGLTAGVIEVALGGQCAVPGGCQRGDLAFSRSWGIGFLSLGGLALTLALINFPLNPGELAARPAPPGQTPAP